MTRHRTTEAPLPDPGPPGPVLVEPLVVLLAARYALGRNTAAATVAAAAVLAHAELIRRRGWAQQLLDCIAATITWRTWQTASPDAVCWRTAAAALLGPLPPADLVAGADRTVPGVFESPDMPLLVGRPHPWHDRIDRVVHRDGRTWTIRGQPRARPAAPAQPVMADHVATVLVPGELRVETFGPYFHRA